MTDYIVVKENTIDLLIESVNENIVEGYVTIGGIATTNNADNTQYYLQAMVKLDYESI